MSAPAAAGSRWVNEEIIAFKKSGRAKRIFCFIVEGEPHSGDDQECFPAAIRFELSPEGEISTIPAEPLAADARSQGDGRCGTICALAVAQLEPQGLRESVLMGFQNRP